MATFAIAQLPNGTYTYTSSGVPVLEADGITVYARGTIAEIVNDIRIQRGPGQTIQSQNFAQRFTTRLFRRNQPVPFTT